MKIFKLKNSQFLALAFLILPSFTPLAHATSVPPASVVAGMTVAQREAQAIELLRKFLNCPVAQVPVWSAFVDQITTLLAGIDKYKDLCTALRSVRNETNLVLGRKRIADAITPHLTNITAIPEDITKTFTKMGYWERINRIKLS